MHLQLGYCFWYQLFLSLVCDADFGLNTLDSELVLWFWFEYTWFWVGFVLAPDISKCWVVFWYQLSCLWHYKKYHVSIWQLFLVKFATKMHYVWQGVVVTISRRKRVALCVSWHWTVSCSRRRVVTDCARLVVIVVCIQLNCELKCQLNCPSNCQLLNEVSMKWIVST